MKIFPPTLCRTLLFTLVLSCAFSANAYFPDSSFLQGADSLFNLPSDTQLTLRNIKKEKHTYFMVTTCKTITQPYNEVVSLLQQADSYPDYFSFITKTDKIANKATPDDSVYMFVGGYGLYRVYFFGKVHEKRSAEKSHFRIFCGNVDQKLYRKAWKNKVRGFIKIGSHDVDIFWTAEKRSDSTTRISITASQAFAAPIANWMISIGTNRIFRGMVTDAEKYLDKIARLKATSEAKTKGHTTTTATTPDDPAKESAPPPATSLQAPSAAITDSLLNKPSDVPTDSMTSKQ